VIRNHILNEAWTDLLSPQVQDLLLSPGDNQHFFRRDKTNVTGVEISIEKGGLGLCNLVQISAYIDRRLHLQRSLVTCPRIVPSSSTARIETPAIYPAAPSWRAWAGAEEIVEVSVVPYENQI
jgi:hypothetical protein